MGLRGGMLGIETMAPGFALPDQDGVVRTLDELRGDGRLVLFFYPRDFSPVCTAQACRFRDAHDRLLAEGTRVAGVSTGSVATHKRFDGRLGLGFPLLSDADRAVSRAYGALGPFGLWARRVSYLIGPGRRVEDRAGSAWRLGPHLSLRARGMG